MQTIKTRIQLVEIAKHTPAFDFAPTPRQPTKMLAIGTRKPGEIVRRGNRQYRVARQILGVMLLVEFFPWRLK